MKTRRGLLIRNLVPKLMVFAGIAGVVVVGGIIISRSVEAAVDASKTYYGRTVYSYSIKEDLKPSKVPLISQDKMKVAHTAARDSGYNSAQSMAITDKYFVIIQTDTTDTRQNHVIFLNKSDFTTAKTLTLALGHANGATYDSKNDEVLVVDGKKVHRIGATSFKYLGTKSITNAKGNQYSATGIAYDANNSRFYASSGDKIRTLTAGDFRIYNYLTSDHVQVNQDIGYYNGYIYRVTWETKGGSEGASWQNGYFNRDDNVILQFAADGSSFSPFYTKNPACEMESIAFDGGKPYILFNACNGKARQKGQYAIVEITDSATLKNLYHKYTVKYDTNGGKWANNDPGDKTNNYVGLYSALAKAKPTRADYNFLGWSKKSDATKASYSAGDKVVLRKYGSKNSDLTLYAVWDEQTYKVSYSANGGSGAPATKSYGKVSNASIKIDAGTGLKRQYYEFIGWSTDKNATVADNNYKPGSTYKGKTNLSLYAVWKPLKYTISYKLNGGTAGPDKTVTEMTKDAKISAKKPVRESYDFEGWALESDKTKVVYKGGENYTGRANLTLYAVWKVQHFVISFDANGGANAPSAIDRAKTVAELSLPNTVPTRDQYKFLKWNTKADGSGTSYSAGAKYTGRSNVTLYAIWKKVEEVPKVPTITITYDANGGDQAPKATIGEVGKVSISGEKPKYDGREFLGWATARDGAVVYLPGAAYAGNTSIVLYAVWRVIPITVSFDANGGENAPAAISSVPGAIRIPENTPTRKGYSFVGWSIGKSADEPDYMPNDVYEENTSIILYAIWNQNSVEVVMYANDGTKDSYKFSVEPGSKVTLTYRPEVRAEYSLLGWSVKKDSEAIDYACDEIVEVGTNGLILYAVWQGPEKTVDFNANGGEGEDETQEATPETIVTDKPVVTVPDAEVERDGYTFEGWSEKEEPTDEDKVYRAGEEYVLPEGTEATLYAKWVVDGRSINEDGCAVDNPDCICEVDVNNQICKNEAKEELPKTGPGEVALLLVSVIAIVTGGVYWYRSFNELSELEKKL